MKKIVSIAIVLTFPFLSNAQSISSLIGDLRRLVANLNKFSDQLNRTPTSLLFGDRRKGYDPNAKLPENRPPDAACGRLGLGARNAVWRGHQRDSAGRRRQQPQTRDRLA